MSLILPITEYVPTYSYNFWSHTRCCRNIPFTTKSAI